MLIGDGDQHQPLAGCNATDIDERSL